MNEPVVKGLATLIWMEPTPERRLRMTMCRVSVSSQTCTIEYDSGPRCAALDVPVRLDPLGSRISFVKKGWLNYTFSLIVKHGDDCTPFDLQTDKKIARKIGEYTGEKVP